MHLRLEDFETYLSTDDISQESLAAIEPIQLHLDSCDHCRKILSQLSIIYHTIDDENLGSSALLLNHEKSVRRGLVLTVLFNELSIALPQEQEHIHKLISDFTHKRYDTYHIDKPEKTYAQPDETEFLNTLDYATLKERPKNNPPFGFSSGPFAAAANIVGSSSVNSYNYHYDGKNLTVSASQQIPVSYMILNPEHGQEMPQVQPVVYDQKRQYYKAVFPLEIPSDAYQILIF